MGAEANVELESDNGTGGATNVALVRSERKATILHEVMQNQAAS
jgi:hypothetical protein